VGISSGFREEMQEHTDVVVEIVERASPSPKGGEGLCL
jgi:hypothetical protein